MNCECIFVLKENRQDISKYLEMAKIVGMIGDRVDQYPVSISKITRMTNCYPDYDQANGWKPKHQKTILNPGDHVLFIGGKYHHMFKKGIMPFLNQEQRQALKSISIVFPNCESYDFFEDIIFFDDFGNVLKKK